MKPRLSSVLVRSTLALLLLAPTLAWAQSSPPAFYGSGDLDVSDGPRPVLLAFASRFNRPPPGAYLLLVAYADGRIIYREQDVYARWPRYFTTTDSSLVQALIGSEEERAAFVSLDEVPTPEPALDVYDGGAFHLYVRSGDEWSGYSLPNTEPQYVGTTREEACGAEGLRRWLRPILSSSDPPPDSLAVAEAETRCHQHHGAHAVIPPAFATVYRRVHAFLAAPDHSGSPVVTWGPSHLEIPLYLVGDRTGHECPDIESYPLLREVPGLSQAQIVYNDDLPGLLGYVGASSPWPSDAPGGCVHVPGGQAMLNPERGWFRLPGLAGAWHADVPF